MRNLYLLITFLISSYSLVAQSPNLDCLGEAGQIQWRYYGDISGTRLSEMIAEPTYPQSPDLVKVLRSIDAPRNYYERFGATMEGFIQAPETGYYDFNLTGDDHSLFKMSLNGLGGPLDTVAHIDGWTGQTEHDKYDSQTADSIYLEKDEFYYFWVIYKEHHGGDHARVHWRRPSLPDTAEWEIIHGTYLFDNACLENCPPAGSACNDGNENTINDQADGYCHCIGTPIESDPCVGDFGSVQALYYDTIRSKYIDDLLTSEFFPAQPKRSEWLSQLSGPLQRKDNYGTRVRAWLYAPESGFYQFNVTGEHQVRFYLGYSDTLAYEEMEMARVDAHTGSKSFYDEQGQTSDSIWLIQDRLYYIELLQQDNWGSEDFAVHWKTPFQTERQWHVIDGAFLRAYHCETACIPQGTACDDGNPLTFDDQYDENCACIGTPCIDEDCSNARDYEPVAACGDQGKHSTHPSDSWSSCAPRQNPNPLRGVSHWIEYDLGDIYVLDNLHIWNYNAADATERGFRTVAVDYSLDGTFWFEAGIFTWDPATGQTDYTGFDWDALKGIGARYLLFTAISNYGGNCSGLSEVQFDVYPCPESGTACNDNDPETENDVFNEFCACQGTPRPTNNCEPRDTLITGTIPLGRHSAGATIIADGKMAPGSNTVLVAGEQIVLRPGFQAGPNVQFRAVILGCNESQEADPLLATATTETQTDDHTQSDVPIRTQADALGRLSLRIQPNPALDQSSIGFSLPVAGEYSLDIRTVSGRLVQSLSRDQFLPEGAYEKEVAVQKLAAGVYFVHFTFEGETITERLIVLRP